MSHTQQAWASERARQERLYAEAHRFHACASPHPPTPSRTPLAHVTSVRPYALDALLVRRRPAPNNQNCGLAEIYLRFAMPIRILMTQSR
jgi:hypothetical protein